MATTLQKYLFDMDFDAPAKPVADEPDMLDGMDEDLLLPEPVDEIPPPPPPPTFSEEDLQLARDQAYESGRLAGISESEGQSARMLANAMTLLTNGLQHLAQAQAQAMDQHVRDSVAVAVMVLKKMLPEMSRRHALDEIEGVVHEVLAQLDQDVRVTIRVSPQQIDAVREHAERAAEACGFEGKLIFSADARLGPGDCRVEWGDGGAERDEARIWAEIELIVARALGVVVPGDPAAGAPETGHDVQPTA